MSAGQLWALPGGYRAIETDRSTIDRLSLLRLEDGAPAFRTAVMVPRNLCSALPMRYHGGNVPADEK
jgi:hypothetical protein